jgi:hypothetical protein
MTSDNPRLSEVSAAPWKSWCKKPEASDRSLHTRPVPGRQELNRASVRLRFARPPCPAQGEHVQTFGDLHARPRDVTQRAAELPHSRLRRAPQRGRAAFRGSATARSGHRRKAGSHASSRARRHAGVPSLVQKLLPAGALATALNLHRQPTLSPVWRSCPGPMPQVGSSKWD